jgi:hypothetical protein
MPLTDLIRYFNAADTSGDSTLYLDGKRAEAWHGGLHLGSLFQPIVDLRRSGSSAIRRGSSPAARTA